MPLFLFLAAFSLLAIYVVWRLLYWLPTQSIERPLVEEGWIHAGSCQPHLISNTFIYGDFTVYRSEKAGFDLVFGLLTSRTSKRLFLSFLFPTSAPYTYASSSPFVLQRRWLAEHKGAIDQFSSLSWYLNESAAALLEPYVKASEDAQEISLLVEQGIGMVMFTFASRPARLDIAALAATAHEIQASVESGANQSFKPTPNGAA